MTAAFDWMVGHLECISGHESGRELEMMILDIRVSIMKMS